MAKNQVFISEATVSVHTRTGQPMTICPKPNSGDKDENLSPSNKNARFKVRHKSEVHVEFGNRLLVAERVDGLIVD